MTIRRAVLALLLALLVLGPVGPLPAYAGGITSVVLTDPTSRQRADAVHYDDRAARDLYDAVGYGSRGTTRQPAALSADGSSEVLLMWLAHGRSVAQLDRLLLTRSDGIWVQTIPVGYPTGAASTDQLGRWRRPADAKSLTRLLAEAGMLGHGVPAGTPAPSPSAPSPSEASPPVEAVPPAEVSSAALPMPAVAGLAAVGGLVLGGLIGARRATWANPAVRGGVPPA